MGEAIVAALARRGAAAASAIVVCDVVAARRDHLRSAYGVSTADAPGPATDGASLVVLAVKPQDLAKVGSSIAGRLDASQTVLSIMAGVRMAEIERIVGHDRIVRAMPNTPAQIGAGFVAWTAAEPVSAEAKNAIADILGTLGEAVEVPGEDDIDMATAVSGSGPGYVYLLIEAMIEGAVAIGLRRDLATSMVTRTVLGSVEYLLATGDHPALLRDRVTSPGGTTAAGIAAMEEYGVRAGVAAAIRAAYERALELGE